VPDSLHAGPSGIPRLFNDAAVSFGVDGTIRCPYLLVRVFRRLLGGEHACTSSVVTACIGNIRIWPHCLQRCTQRAGIISFHAAPSVVAMIVIICAPTSCSHSSGHSESRSLDRQSGPQLTPNTAHRQCPLAGRCADAADAAAPPPRKRRRTTDGKAATKQQPSEEPEVAKQVPTKRQAAARSRPSANQAAAKQQLAEKEAAARKAPAGAGSKKVAVPKKQSAAGGKGSQLTSRSGAANAAGRRKATAAAAVASS
jgi:hypothetical protein